MLFRSETITAYLQTSGMPDPDLIIRTSGEMRLSNFLLWEAAYSELFVTDTLWPDFHRPSYYKALASYVTRERRFGKTSAQLDASEAERQQHTTLERMLDALV